MNYTGYNLPFILVDGGGSTCRVTITQPQGKTLGSAVGGAANLNTDLEKALNTIRATVKLALENAKLDPEQSNQYLACLGLAGANVANVTQDHGVLLPYRESHIVSDRDISIKGALGNQNGIVANLGTGSFFSKQQNGDLTHVGGWGLTLGDECSGAWLGRECLKEVICANDMLTSQTPFSNELTQQLGGANHHIVGFAQNASPENFAQFAPSIFLAAKNDDALALKVIKQSVSTLQNRLQHFTISASMKAHLMGGLAAHYFDHLDDTFKHDCVLTQGNALQGALTMAKQRWNVES